MRTLSLPTATTMPSEVGLSPSTPSPNQRPQTLSKAHEILGIATPTRMTPTATQNQRSPRASPQYQHKPFRSSRSPSMVELRKEACNESTSASPAKEKEEKKEKVEEKGEKTYEVEESYWWKQLRLLEAREPQTLGPMSEERREIWRQIDWEIIRSWSRKEEGGT